jgi:hypothetical protein
MHGLLFYLPNFCMESFGGNSPAEGNVSLVEHGIVGVVAPTIPRWRAVMNFCNTHYLHDTITTIQM